MGDTLRPLIPKLSSAFHRVSIKNAREFSGYLKVAATQWSRSQPLGLQNFDSAGRDGRPSVPAGVFTRDVRKSLAGMDCPEKKLLSRNSATVHRGVGVVRLDSLEAVAEGGGRANQYPSPVLCGRTRSHRIGGCRPTASANRTGAVLPIVGGVPTTGGKRTGLANPIRGEGVKNRPKLCQERRAA